MPIARLRRFTTHASTPLNTEREALNATNTYRSESDRLSLQNREAEREEYVRRVREQNETVYRAWTEVQRVKSGGDTLLPDIIRLVNSLEQSIDALVQHGEEGLQELSRSETPCFQSFCDAYQLLGNRLAESGLLEGVRLAGLEEPPVPALPLALSTTDQPAAAREDHVEVHEPGADSDAE